MTAPTASATIGQALDIPGTTNLRSTAGYPSTGGVLRESALFRSDALHNLGESGITAIQGLGVVRVLDLRDEIELGLEPSALASTPIELLHQPIFGEGGLAGIGSFAIDDVYRFVIEQRAEELTRAVTLIAEAPEGGVLVHCTAGKDRTGLVVATVLSLVGVPHAQIIADYAASEHNIAGERADRILEAARMRFGDLDEGAIELMVGSPARAIEAALNVIEEHWGSTRDMFLGHGGTEATLTALHNRLITNTDEDAS